MEKAVRVKVFYGDPGAEKIAAKVDEFYEQLICAYFDKDHVLWKSLSKQQAETLFLRLLKHHEFRAKLDWAKERYYEVGQADLKRASAESGNTFRGIEVGLYE